MESAWLDCSEVSLRFCHLPNNPATLLDPKCFWDTEIPQSSICMYMYMVETIQQTLALCTMWPLSCYVNGVQLLGFVQGVFLSGSGTAQSLAHRIPSH